MTDETPDEISDEKLDRLLGNASEQVLSHIESMLSRARLDMSDPLPHDMRNPHEDRECDEEHCIFCVGGIEVCAVCGGAEACLTTHCSGAKMPIGTQEEVQRGRIDFRGKAWVEL